MAKRKSLNEIINEINDKWKGQFIITEDLTKYEYSNVHQKIKIRCTKCQNEYDKRINDLLHGYGCNKCSNVKRRTVEEMKSHVKTITRGEYELVSDHNKTRDIATFKHNSENCKNPNPDKLFKKKIHNFITIGQRCPFCAECAKGIKDSKGILKIKSFLEDNKIDFESEYKFEECRSVEYNRLLPFDIFIPSLKTLIEFDGEQHFKAAEIFGGEEAFRKLKNNDETKNQFASNNGYTLIRISYKEYFKIDKILKEKLSIK